MITHRVDAQGVHKLLNPVAGQLPLSQHYPLHLNYRTMWKRFVRAIKSLFGGVVSSMEDPKLILEQKHSGNLTIRFRA